jgi:DNA invertase Pin-like site-specific DNA recombinase
MSTAIYIRTSTDDQHGEAQLAELRKAAPSAFEFVDIGVSGATPARQRPAMRDLLRDVERGRTREVVVWALDRLGRNTIDVLLLVDDLGRAGVTIRSLRDGVIDATSPIGRCMLTILAAFAEMERNRIRERVKAGIANRKAKGLAIGRARRQVDDAKVIELRAQGVSWRAIARAMKVPTRTLQRVVYSVAKTP